MTTLLEQMDVAVVDCQTTGASPSRGQVLEIAWARLSESSPGDVERVPISSAIVSLPEGQELPARITKLTGIESQMVQDGKPEQEVWGELIRGISAGSGSIPVPIVAHYARFERSFLRDWAQRYQPEVALSFYCTHEMARRSLAGLARYGLRAVAGYLGYRLPELKRAEDHVRATIWVWRELLTRVAQRAVSTPEQLLEWLATPPPPRQVDFGHLVSAETRKQLPTGPGVYRFYDRTGALLYVGKATNLRQRVGSYFQKKTRRAEHTLEMITQAADLKWEETSTPTEAALLEVDGIKEHNPPYNRALKASEESVWFFDNELGEAVGQPGNGFNVGPFPRLEPVQQLGWLALLLTDRGE